jgi:phage-related protein
MADENVASVKITGDASGGVAAVKQLNTATTESVAGVKTALAGATAALNTLPAAAQGVASAVAASTSQGSAALSGMGNTATVQGGVLSRVMASIRGAFGTVPAAATGMASAVGAGAAKGASAMDGLHNATATSVSGMKSALSSVTGAFTGLMGVFAGVAVAVAGGAFFKSAIADSVKLTGETTRLARTLGITGEEANTLNTALGDIYTDSDTYIGAFQKFAGQLRRNEDGMKEMGIKTRDANGNLREGNDVFREAVAVVGKYKPGLDQTTAAQTLFGKSIDDVMKLQKLSNDVLDDAKQKNEDLNMVITDENVAAAKSYKAAMNDVDDVMTGVTKTVGDAVMPIFTEMAVYFAQVGPTAITIFKVALTGLMLVFRVVQGVIKGVSNVIFEFINYVIDQVGNLSTLISSVLAGDFTGAGKAASAMADRVTQGFSNIKNAAIDTYEATKDAFSEDLTRTWGDKVAANIKGSKGTKTMGEFKDKKDTKDKVVKEKSRVPEWEAELEARKVTYQKENDLREMSKAQELAYWATIASTTTLTEKERISLKKKTAQTELEIMKEQRAQQIALSEESIEAYRNQQLSVLDAVVQENQFKVDTQRMTNLEMLQSDAKLEDKRYQIMREAMEARAGLLRMDPTKNVVALTKLNNELAAAEREHTTRQRGVTLATQREQIQGWQDAFNTIGQTFGKAISGIIQGTMTLAQATKSIFQSILGTVGDYIGQMIAKKLVGLAMEKLFALSEVKTNAARAGAGAAASVAGIPIVGPALAVAALASVSGAVGAAGTGMIMSARNGYDIPAGVNPMTQLHEREMVLPQAQADAVRSMADGGGGGGSTNTIHLSTLDAKSFESWLRGGGGDTLLKFMGGRKRDFAYKP